MRDNRQGLPELLAAYERDGRYFAEVAVTINGDSRSFEIGLTPPSYTSFKKMISFRPFDNSPGLTYRYFFVPSVGGTIGASVRTTQIRVEQGKNGKQFDIEAPKELIANLIWFFELKDFVKAAHLKETKKPQPSGGGE
jgi:hypothetical protein